MRAPCCDPTATISAPSLATPLSTWVMPRPLPAAAVKSPPARVAGGNPSAVACGACPWWLLFAPTMTATTTPTTTMARIGTTTLSPAPRNRSAARNSASRLRLAGAGRNERIRPLHSACASPCGTRLLAPSRVIRTEVIRTEQARAERVPAAGGGPGVELEARLTFPDRGGTPRTGQPGGPARLSRFGLDRWSLARWSLARGTRAPACGGPVRTPRAAAAPRIARRVPRHPALRLKRAARRPGVPFPPMVPAGMTA